MITPDILIGDGQVVVQLAVDRSRSVCLSVAHGEVDVAIIGGHVPEDLKDVLQVCQSWLKPTPSRLQPLSSLSGSMSQV